jgi:hypothetical protein
MDPLDPRKTWWWERQTQTRLTKWAIALLQGRPYTVNLVDKGSSYILPEEHIIQINAQMFPKRDPNEQFTATQGLLAHEVGHAFFTEAWPDGERESRLREMTNILEDCRVEQSISIYYPGIAENIRFLGDLMLKKVGPYRNRAAEQAYLCCLTWRWANSRISETSMLDRMEIGREGRQLWDLVRPLVEMAWVAESTTGVIKISRQILTILEIEPEVVPMKPFELWNDDLPLERTDQAQLFPGGPCETTQPGRGKGLEGSAVFQCDSITTPLPYHEVEAEAFSLANQLIDELRLPAQNERLEPDEWGGRYSFRQELRTPETPNLLRKGEDLSSHGLAIHILVDRSGSMSSVNEVVRLALMAVYLACTQLGIPIGISYFGADQEKEQTLLVSPPLPFATESAKALIAGFEGKTSNEFLYWGLIEAETSLTSCREQTKLILVVHDGEPVYKGPDGNDWTLSHAAIRRLMKEGFLVIGLFLHVKGHKEHMSAGIHKLSKLFPKLVISDNQQFAQKLGNFLRSLSTKAGFD